MNILLVGSGGREHALAWKIAQSPLLDRLVCAPGNPGIERLCETRPVAATDVEGLVALAREIAADLVVVGPESALERGLANALALAGIPCFGPSQAAARLETSKAFTKDFCARHGLPTAAYGVFADAGPAWVEALGPRALLEEFEAARVGRQRDALCIDQLRGIEPVQLTRRECAGKDADYTCGMEPNLVKSPFGHRAESRTRLYAGDIRRQQVAARAAELSG